MQRNYFIKDINTYPSFEEKSETKLDKKLDAEGRRELTIGDLHANALKLLHFLILNQIIVMSKADFDSFVEIYNTANNLLDREKLKKLSAIVDMIKVTDESITVRLIGDEVADRGSNDYFVLKLIKKLREKKNLELEILYSNHGQEFLQVILEEQKPTPGLIPEEFASLCNFLFLRRKNFFGQCIVSDEEKATLVASYKPLLKLMSYTLPTLKTPLMIYSHAALKNPIETINDLAKALGVAGLSVEVSYSSSDIAKAIDRINSAFQIRIKDRTFHKIYKLCRENPFARIAWDRVDPVGNQYGFDQYEFNTEIRKNFMITVHGHSMSVQLPDNVNLDNDNILGKGVKFATGNLPFFESVAPFKPVLTNSHVPSIQPAPTVQISSDDNELKASDFLCPMSYASMTSTLSASSIQPSTIQAEVPGVSANVLWIKVGVSALQVDNSQRESRRLNNS